MVEIQKHLVFVVEESECHFMTTNLWEKEKLYVAAC
jgi:hypothetical protein